VPAYRCPDTLEQALSALSTGDCTAVAGGTDFYPALNRAQPDCDVLDLSRIAALRGIKYCGNELHIGATTTWSELRLAKLPPALYSLQQAAGEVGALQIQNAGTLGGNLCNASPAADGVPPLLALDAQVELQSPGHTRRLPLTDFITGVRRTALQPGELLTTIIIPDIDREGHSQFLKLGSRHSLVISIVMVAVCLHQRAGQIATARIAVGACSPVALRLPAAEQALAGRPWTDSAASELHEQHCAPLSPIDDIRASAGYRQRAALTLVQRAVQACLAAGGTHS
jgi:CO/xanthine dehydrogenase FAD-binding subunit